MFRKHSKRFWLALALVATVCVFYFPSLLAYRYTASSQNTHFLTHPWHSWEFLYATLTVPGDSKLKTSGPAIREADKLFAGTGVRVVNAQLLFLTADKPYTFSQKLGDRRVVTTVVPPFRLVWQVEGTVSSLGREHVLVVMFLDYRSATVLYDIRTDLGRQRTVSPRPTATKMTSTPAGSSTQGVTR